MKPRPGGPLMVLHVLLDEPGGGPAHVERLTEQLGGRAESHVLTIADGALGWRAWRWLAAARSIRAASRSKQVDVIHAHGTRAAMSVRLSQALGKQASVVVTIHGLHLIRRSSGLVAGPARFLTRFALRKADRVLVLSDSDMETLSSQGLASKEQLRRTTQPFLAPARRERPQSKRDLGFDPDSALVLWLGRFEDVKDPLLFVAAAGATERSGVFFAMAGDGPLKPEAEKLAGRSASGVCFLGWLDDPSVALSAADVVVSTSRWEGLPHALLQAASCGCFIVATDVPGNRDLIEAGLPGALIGGREAEHLSIAIVEAIEDPEALSNASEAGPGAVARVLGNAAADVLGIYRELATPQ